MIAHYVHYRQEEPLHLRPKSGSSSDRFYTGLYDNRSMQNGISLSFEQLSFHMLSLLLSGTHVLVYPASLSSFAEYRSVTSTIVYQLTLEFDLPIISLLQSSILLHPGSGVVE
jgi:hypothetical protein